jgi:hypothetical protein
VFSFSHFKGVTSAGEESLWLSAREITLEALLQRRDDGAAGCGNKNPRVIKKLLGVD